MLDFEAVRNKQTTLAELAKDLTAQDLHALTDEMIDTMHSLIAGATDADVVFEPIDLLAEDPYAVEANLTDLAWTLAHVIVHATASSEEAAAQACELARGVAYEGRSRYEVPWQTVTTIAQVRRRLEESRRMRHALLDAWPDQPHLETTVTADHPKAKPRNCIMRFIAGLAHDEAHLDQIAEIMRQSKAQNTDFTDFTD
jgi:hypothetical protein